MLGIHLIMVESSQICRISEQLVKCPPQAPMAIGRSAPSASAPND